MKYWGNPEKMWIGKADSTIRYFIRALKWASWWLALSASMLAQSLPDAPSTSQPVRHEPKTAITSPCGSTGCWDYDHPNLSIVQTFKSRNFYVPVGLAEASYWSDVGFSLSAIHRGCTEGNPDLPARPVLGQYFENWAKTELPLDILQWSIVKLNRKPTNIMSHIMGMVRMGVHGNGIYVATQCR